MLLKKFMVLLKIENLDRVQSSFMLCLRRMTGGRFLMWLREGGTKSTSFLPAFVTHVVLFSVNVQF